MFKKVVCLLLVLACSVVLFACGNNGNGSANLGGPTGGDDNKTTSEGSGETGDKTTDKELVADKTVNDYALEQAFFKAISNSRYNLIKTKIETSSPTFEELGPITSLYQFSLLDDGDYELEFTREAYNKVGEETMKTSTGPCVVLYEDGEYFYGEKGEELVKVTKNPDPNALDYKLEFDPQYLGSYTISEDGCILSAKVGALDLERILGVSLSATSAFDLKIEIRGGSLYMVTLDYSNNSDSVHIETSYTYETK